MAQELSEKERLKLEVEQLKKEVRNPRAPVSPAFPSLPPLVFSIAAWSLRDGDPREK